MINFLKEKKEDLFLLSTFSIISLAIILKSYFNFNGYISPDSGYYLALAKHLMSGEGFLISAYEYGGNKNEFFATWAVGYPVLIMLASKLTGLSIFWSSKVLNIFLLGFLFIILRLLFKKNAYIYSLVFFFSSYLEIFSFTWSENLFLASMVFFAYCLNNIIISSENSFIQYSLLLLSTALLFLSRYIGVFSICVLILILIYLINFNKEKKKIFIIFSISLFNIILVAGYFYNNFLNTGFISGIRDINSVETNFQLIASLLKALLAEFLIPVHTIYSLESKYLSVIFLLLQSFVIFFIYLKYIKQIKEFFKKRNISSLTLIFALISFVYMFVLIFLRWIMNFDSFGYRLFAPGTLMISFSIISFILQSNSFNVKKKFLTFFFPFVFFSLLLNFPVKIIFQKLKNPLTYIDHQNKIINEYIDVEKNSVVIFSNRRHIRYLRNDLERRNPYRDENWVDFINRIDPGKSKNIYLKNRKNTMDFRVYDESIFRELVKYPPNKMIKIK